jgi:hypothetical protein
VVNVGDGGEAVEFITRGILQARADAAITVRFTADDPGKGAIDGSMLLTSDGAFRDGGVRVRVKSDALSCATVARLSTAYLGQASVDATGTIALDATGSFGDALPHIQGSVAPIVSVKVLSSDPTNLATTNLSATRGVFYFDMVLSRENPIWNFTVEGLDFRADEATVEGMSGAIEIDRFPIGSTWLSDVRATRVSFGKMELSDAHVSFAIDNPRRVAIRQARVGWLDGTVQVASVFIDPMLPKVKTTVDVSNVNAEKLLTLLAETYASTTGQVSGTVNFELDWPEIRLGTGKLSVAGGGRLQFKDKQMLARLLGQDAADPRALEAEHRQAAIDALNDFEFEQMSAEMVETPAGHVTRLVLRGRGRTGTRQPLDLQLNITGVNDALYYGLILGRQLPF